MSKEYEGVGVLLRRAIKQACHTFAGADKRWKAAIKRGMSDAELKEAIGYALGIEGGYSEPGGFGFWYKGGKNPEVQLRINHNKGARCSGMNLVQRVRLIFGIPKKG